MEGRMGLAWQKLVKGRCIFFMFWILTKFSRSFLLSYSMVLLLKFGGSGLIGFHLWITLQFTINSHQTDNRQQHYCSIDNLQQDFSSETKITSRTNKQQYEKDNSPSYWRELVSLLPSDKKPQSSTVPTSLLLLHSPTKKPTNQQNRTLHHPSAPVN